jgi:hypothetical protein
VRVVGRGWNLRVKWYLPEEVSWDTLALIFGDGAVADVRADVAALDRWADEGGMIRD